jgi:hypothetical protein
MIPPSPDPLVSVVMAVHNDGPFVSGAVGSILGQTLAAVELIVVDDASTDDTPGVLAGFADARLRILRNEINLGLTRSLGRAIPLTRAAYVARMDGDDVSLPERLERQVAFLDDHPDHGMVGCAAARIDAGGRILGRFEVPLGDEEIRAYLRRRNGFVHGTLMIRRAVLDATGGYDETLRFAQDYDLAFRVLERSKAANLREVLYLFRATSTRISVRHAREQEAAARAIRERAGGDGVARALSIPTPGVRSRSTAHTSIGVVVLAGDDLEALERTLASVDVQARPPATVVVVGGDARPDARAVAGRHGAQWLSGGRGVVPALVAIRRGVRAAGGTLVTIVAAGEALLPEYVALHESAADAFGDGVVSLVGIRQTMGAGVRPAPLVPSAGDLRVSLCYDMPAPLVAFAVPPALLDRGLALDEAATADLADAGHALLMQVALAGIPCVVHPVVACDTPVRPDAARRASAPRRAAWCRLWRAYCAALLPLAPDPALLGHLIAGFVHRAAWKSATLADLEMLDRVASVLMFLHREVDRRTDALVALAAGDALGRLAPQPSGEATMRAGLRGVFERLCATRRAGLDCERELGRHWRDPVGEAEAALVGLAAARRTTLERHVEHLVRHVLRLEPRRVAVFGAGGAGRAFLKAAHARRLAVDAVVDSDPARWGTTVGACAVMSLDAALASGVDLVVIPSLTFAATLRALVEERMRESGRTVAIVGAAAGA